VIGGEVNFLNIRMSGLLNVEVSIFLIRNFSAVAFPSDFFFLCVFDGKAFFSHSSDFKFLLKYLLHHLPYKYLVSCERARLGFYFYNFLVFLIIYTLLGLLYLK